MNYCASTYHLLHLIVVLVLSYWALRVLLALAVYLTGRERKPRYPRHVTQGTPIQPTGRYSPFVPEDEEI